MELAQLETFVAVAEEKGFSRAAARLHRTQPAVSHAVRKLEQELGETLFERSSREGTLTAAGEVLKDYALRLIKLRGEAQNAVRELKSLERGRLELAANEYTCLYLLRILDRFQKMYPQIGVTVHRSLASKIPEQILERTAEIGVLSFRPDGGQFRSIVVYEDDSTFVVSPGHPLARQAKVSIGDLGAENFIAHNVPSPLRQYVISAFARYKTPLNMGVELPSLEAIKRFVAMGNGVALVPGLTVEQELARGELIRIPVEGLQIARQLRIVHREEAILSHAALAFLKVIQSLAAERGRPFQYRLERESEP